MPKKTNHSQTSFPSTIESTQQFETALIHPSSLKLILKQKQIIRRRHGNDVLRRMPGRVQYFLIKIQTVHTNLVLLPFAARAHLARPQHGPRLGDLLGRLQCALALRRPVEHAEEVVVRARHDGRVGAVPAALELVEDAVVLVEGAQFGTQVFVNLKKLIYKYQRLLEVFLYYQIID